MKKIHDRKVWIWVFFWIRMRKNLGTRTFNKSVDLGFDPDPVCPQDPVNIKLDPKP